MLVTFAFCLVLIGLDQILKYWVVATLAPDGALTLIRGVLELRYVENNGAAFSLLAGKQLFLIAITTAALLAVGYILFFKTKRFRLDYFAFLLIFTGGVGNLIDRIVNRYVVDYINVLFVHFAVFNFADCLVCIGFLLLVISFVRAELAARREKKHRDGQADGAR